MKYFLCLFILLGLFALWAYKGFAETGIHVDLARDLHFLSEIWVGKIVWLGPMTSANFPASPVYYYLLFPGLLLSGGNGLSIIASQTFFAFLALGFFAFFQAKRSSSSALLIILAIGLSPWWINSSSNPWNGHMYVSWLFLALTSLWFKNPILLSALLFGTSIAINPVAALGLPVLFYEWWTGANRIKRFILALVGLLLPWLPIILYEIITKGFLTRQFLTYPATAGLIPGVNTVSLNLLLNTAGITPAFATVAWLTAFLIGTKREKYWVVFTSLPLLFLVTVYQLRGYYLLGLICALAFTILSILSTRVIGKIILITLIILYTQTIQLPSSLASRSIQQLDKTVNLLTQSNKLDKTKKYAVVSIRDRQNSTPQADDYRFFLRTKGINALSIDEYPQADILLLFVEVPNFDWKNFEDWHTSRFGNRKFLSSQIIDGIEVIMYGRN